MGTQPRTPSTTRTRSGAFPRSGMQSMRRTEPSAVVNSVSSTSVPSR
jgi:hypothetical protein